MNEGRLLVLASWPLAKPLTPFPTVFLLQKLEGHSLDGNTLYGVKNCLDDWAQRMAMKGITSSWQQVTRGGPMLSVGASPV